MFTRLMELKSRVILKRLGESAWTIPPDRMFETAIEYERYKNICGPFDPAFEYYSQRQQDWEQLAYLKEYWQNGTGL